MRRRFERTAAPGLGNRQGRALARALGFLAFGAACVIATAAAILFALERSGWIADWTRAELRARLSGTSTEVELDDVELDWLAPAVRVRGLRLGAQGRLCEIERATILLSPRSLFDRDAPPVRAVRLEGGRVRLSSELAETLERLRGTGAAAHGPGTPPAGGPALEEVAAVPPIEVRDLDLALAHPRLGDLPLGRVEASFVRDEEGRADLSGALAPSFARETDDGARIFVRGRVEGPRRLSLSLSTAELPLSTAALPPGTPLEGLREFDPRGTFSLEGRALVSFDEATPSTVELRARLAAGSLTRASTGLSVTGLAFDTEASWASIPGAEWTDARCWSVLASASGEWADGPLNAFARFGRAAGAERTFSAELRAATCEVSPERLAELGAWSLVAAEYHAIEPRGRADVAAGIARASDGRWSGALDVVLDGSVHEVNNAGVANVVRACYQGWPTETGRKPESFPLPMTDVRGRVIVHFDPAAPRPFHVGLLGIDGRPQDGGTGAARATVGGLIAADEQGEPGDGWPEFLLEFRGEDIAVGEPARRAVEGLLGTQWIWPAFRPEAGTVSGHGLLFSDPSNGGVGGRFTLRPRDCRLAWEGLPVPVERLSGQLELWFDPRLLFGVTFDVAGATPTAESVRVRGRVQQDPLAPVRGAPQGTPQETPQGTAPGTAPGTGPGATEDADLLMDFDIAVGAMGLRGTDREIIAATWPGVGQALDLFQPSGKADIRARVSRGRPGDGLDFRVEVEPQKVQITPTSFSTPTRNVAGRVLVEGREGPSTAGGAAESAFTTRIAPLIGEWPQDARVACLATFPSRGEDHLEVLGAGVDIANRGLVGAFREAFGGEAGAGGFDLRALSIDGRIDFAADMRLSTGADGRTQNVGVYRVYLRDNAFRAEGAALAGDSGAAAGGFELSHLWGELVQREGVLTGERVRAVLGNTPVELEDARFVEEAGTVRFSTRVRTGGLPLDERHLSLFLDADTVRAALEQLHLAGTLDFEDARLEYVGKSEKQNPRVMLSGKVRLRDAYVDLGLPLSIEDARVDLAELVLEGGHVRAWARVFDLDGSIARRKLENTRMLVTYVEPRLSLLDLWGDLEGGRIADLAAVDGPGGRARTSASGPAFTMDLLEPYRFELGLALRDVQILGLLRGMFQSEFADTGLLDAEIRLEGSLEHLTGIGGDGYVHMRDTRLWSIPVMRDLLSQLGLDSSAVFERMQSRFSLQGGVIRMDAMHVESPLLQLVGSGELDLDGRLHHDLQVRFALVDRLGPVTRLWYWIQNNLLSVSIRGDMARPQVVFKGALSFLASGEKKKRELPLPALSPLPPRF